jgi:hypothetical protein
MRLIQPAQDLIEFLFDPIQLGWHGEFVGRRGLSMGAGGDAEQAGRQEQGRKMVHLCCPEVKVPKRSLSGTGVTMAVTASSG